MSRCFGAVVVLLATMLAGSGVPAIAAGTERGSSRTRLGAERVRPSEIVVRYRSLQDAAVTVRDVPSRLVERVPAQDLEVIDPVAPLDEAIAQLERDPNVVYAEPNYVYEASALTPNDPRYGSMWGLDKIQMPAAWDVTRGSKNVTVAVVDTGVALAHPDLAPNIWANPQELGSGKENNDVDDDRNGYRDDWRGWDWVGNDNRPGDAHGHGTHVAGTIGARGNDAYGVTGINWGVSLLPLRALDESGVGTTADIAAAFHYAGRLGVDVVNASFGGTDHSVALREAIAAYPETLFVVAAGNEATNNDVQQQYPCSYDLSNVICVAASDQDDGLAGFSNHGSTSVDLAAPGVSILSTAPAFSSPLTETFETELGSRWTTGGTNNLWSRGVDAYGGYLADSLDADYRPDTNSWVATAQPFSLAGQTECRLHYDLLLDTEPGLDALFIEASSDASSWTKVEGWTGSSGGYWRAMNDNLGAFDRSEEVFVRFRLLTNASVNGRGADIDNVAVRCQAESYSGEEFQTSSGTSMAAPHVSGVAALLRATSPEATVRQIVSAILSGAETVPGLSGKVATSARLSAFGALEALAGRKLGETSSPVADPTPTSSPAPTPDPTPISEPGPSPQPGSGPAPQPAPAPAAPAPGPVVQPEPAPDPAPSSDPGPAPVPAPIEPEDAGAEEHARSIGLRLSGSLVARGRVSVSDGYQKCARSVVVKIKRNGTTIARTKTDGAGFYRARIADRRGRYIAVAVSTVPATQQACLAARSRSRVR